MNLKDETGKTYGRLKVIERYDPEKHGDFHPSCLGAYWLCQCECGEKAIVYGGALRKGQTHSCGCLRREATAERRRASRKREVQ